jgi:hypothetical protein
MKECTYFPNPRIKCSIPDEPNLTPQQREQECRKCGTMLDWAEQHQEDVM